MDDRMSQSISNLLNIIQDQDKQIKYFQQLLIGLLDAGSDDQSKNFYPVILEYLTKEAGNRE